MQVSGVAASLAWGYTSAATLGAWQASRQDDGRWRLTAQLISADTFRVAQRPLRFEARHAKGAWRWPVIELQMTSGSLTAILGACEG